MELPGGLETSQNANMHGMKLKGAFEMTTNVIKLQQFLAIKLYQCNIAEFTTLSNLTHEISAIFLTALGEVLLKKNNRWGVGKNFLGGNL